MASLTIGKVAKAARVNVETVRYYERRGLIKQPKSTSGFREYPRDVIARIQFIRRSQQLGFTLAEIAELLRLSNSTSAKRDAIKKLAQEKLASIQERIVDLQRIEQTLSELVHECSGQGPVHGCPIIEAIVQNIDSLE